jgi:hypothetical protein
MGQMGKEASLPGQEGLGEGALSRGAPSSSHDDPAYYLERLTALEVAVELPEDDDGHMDPLDAKRSVEFLEKACKARTGINLSDLHHDSLSPLQLLDNKKSFLEMTERELSEVEASIESVKELSVKKKSRWCDAIKRTRRLQKLAKSKAVYFMLYVGRDDETGAVFKLAENHLRIFAALADDSAANILIMAHPGSGKSTVVRHWNMRDIGEHPHYRFLFLYGTEEKGEKEIVAMKANMNHGRFRAIYPHVEIARDVEGVDGKKTRLENSTRRFTVTRPNYGSKEPTAEAAAVCTDIQGSGYDRICADDPCPPEVADQPAVRERINRKWRKVIEQRLRNPAIASIRMVCTPWHNDDLAGTIQREIREGKRKDWKVHTTPVKEDRAGNPVSLWPERFTPDYYRTVQLRLTPTEYAQLYQMECRAESDKIIKHLCFFPADKDDEWDRLPQEIREKYEKRLQVIYSGEQWLSIDPSATTGKGSSETAVTQISITAEGNAYVVDCWFFPGDVVEIQEFIVSAITKEMSEGRDFRLPKTRIDRILFEYQGGMTGTVALWEAFIRRKLEEMAFDWKGGMYRATTRMGGGQNKGKDRRLRHVAGMIENGIIKFPGRVTKDGRVVQSERENVAKLCEQLLNFPVGFNDGVDTITQFLAYTEPRLVHEDANAPEGGQRKEPLSTIRSAKLAELGRMRQPDNQDTFYRDELAVLNWN